MGFRKKPGLSTINRVLKINDLIIEKSRHKNETTSRKYYPTIKAKHHILEIFSNPLIM
jgi:hypothetical protein